MAHPINSTPNNSIETSFLALRRIVRDHGRDVMRKLFDDHVTGLFTKKIVKSCFLCCSEKELTKEHVLPRWVFDNNVDYRFTSDVNQLSQSYMKATLPACFRCNNELLNRIEQYIQKTLLEVDLKKRYYSPAEWGNIIRWLEIIDFKFQVWNISTKFLKHKQSAYIPDFADFSIAFMRDPSVRSITSKARLSLRRMRKKDKRGRFKSLIVGKTKGKTFHYFHTSGQFMHLEIPVNNKFFFYFFEKEHKTDKSAQRESMNIMKQAYNL